MEIAIKVRNKVAASPHETIVCGNSDYTLAFDFDEEWNAYEAKTARFVYGGKFEDVVFTGNICAVPTIQNATVCEVGVYAGNLRTTTPALISCNPSILCKGGLPADPAPDVYAQLMEKLNSIDPNGGGRTYPIKYVESMDTENMVNLRDIESGIYILYGYFKPFPGSDSTIIIDEGYYMIVRVDAGSHLLSITPLNFRMTCHEILVDDTNEKGFTYTNTRINLLDVAALIGGQQ